MKLIYLLIKYELRKMFSKQVIRVDKYEVHMKVKEQVKFIKLVYQGDNLVYNVLPSVGFCPRFNLIIKYINGKIEIVECDLKKLEVDGTYEDLFRYVRLRPDAIVMEQFYENKNYHFLIRNKHVFQVRIEGKYYPCHPDGYCPGAKMRFIYYPDRYFVRVITDPFPHDGEYSSDFRWINFINGKVNVEKYNIYSMSQMIRGKEYQFVINDNKLEAARIEPLENDFTRKMYPVINGECLELKMRFTFDTNDYIIKYEPLNIVEAVEETKNGKIIYLIKDNKVIKKRFYEKDKLIKVTNL